MKTKSIIFAALSALTLMLFSACSMFGKNGDTEYWLVKENGKWGYVDGSGNYVINPQFEEAGPFNEGVALVRTNGMIGYINTQGQYVINAQYADGTIFNDGMAFVVEENSTPICINKKGEHVFTLKQEAVIFFNEGLAAFMDDKSKCGFVDHNGNIAIVPQFKLTALFTEGMAAVSNDDNKWGFVDKTGVLAVPYQFDEVGVYSEGYAAFRSGSNWGFLDKDGKYAINPQYDEVGAFSDGLAAVYNGNTWGFIDKDGKYVINPQFENVGAFQNGLAPFLMGDKWGYIDKKGKIVINAQFEEATQFEGKLAPVKISGKWGFIDKEGKIVINPRFDKVIDPDALQYRTYIVSNFYDTEKIVDGLFGTEERYGSILIDQINANTTYGSYKKIKAFAKADLWRSDATVVSYGKTITDEAELSNSVAYFKSSVVSDSYYDYAYGTFRYTYDNSAVLNAACITIELSGTARQKSKAIAKSLSTAVESKAGVSMQRKDQLYYGYNSQKKLGYVVEIDGNNILISVVNESADEFERLIKKEGTETSVDEEEVESVVEEVWAE